ncbi:hypothetical protein [Burkholderia latens]|uniref:hypothetical protein n=1 Tax=Burkholderia latens TaxID=488446 RepID=UPI001AEA52A5|nr:hypothetical protein [Burkholderia latens]QTO46305.1 hypothetical protein J8I85_17820 [Burkholderia latens]
MTLNIKDSLAAMPLRSVMRTISKLTVALNLKQCPWTLDELESSPAFAAGWRAREAGALMKNPHRKGSFEWHAWHEGFERNDFFSRQW